MKKTLLNILLISSLGSLYGQVGIQTSQVAPSAILEINTSDLATGSKKGFLGPRVALASNTDTTTIPSPAVGLLVYNTVDAGTYPSNVFANRYYFWNGTLWVDLGLTSALQNYLSNKIYSLNSKSTQNLTYSTINNTSGTNGGIPVSFADGDVAISTGNIVTKLGDVFTVNVTGLYEISAYVNYNPNRTTIAGTQGGTFLNLKLQRSTDNGATWADVIGNRTAWGVKATNYLKTAILISTPVYLTANQRLRLVVQNPFGITDESALHGENNTTSPPPTMTTSTKIPISKSLTMILLDYDLQ
ncbi:hypothetical protein [Epilithonimonas hominis]|uniref:Uncharacterized protein n=1 Tax=Epilithonimonas hominis TaxID=420404 RepID=A0A1H6J1D1_9FLAO|nr:hypothetical protein [Epilithonimonas hominis]SEH53941.1 hypothetical protein SAMN05421793_11058 [Epilithonimonas hominis]